MQGISYWVRRPAQLLETKPLHAAPTTDASPEAQAENNAAHRPVVFLHGVGLGLVSTNVSILNKAVLNLQTTLISICWSLLQR